MATILSEDIEAYIYAPEEGSEKPGYYLVKFVDPSSGIILKSMVNQESVEAYNEHFNDDRAVLEEYEALYEVRLENESSYYTLKPESFEKYSERRTFDADRFKKTVFSAFVIEHEDQIIGRLGIGQGYYKDEARLEELKSQAEEFDISEDEIYVPSINETQIGTLLKLEYYSKDLYNQLTTLAGKIALFLKEKDFLKPVNAPGDYFDLPLLPIDRWTFTMIEPSKISQEEFSEEDLKILQEKKIATEQLCQSEIIHFLGFLLPSDERNYSETTRAVYGIDI